MLVVRCIFVFSLWSVAVPCGYFRDGRFHADGPASGQPGFRTSIVVIVCRGLGGGRLGIRDRVIGRFVYHVGGREMRSVFARDVGSCDIKSRCLDLIL